MFFDFVCQHCGQKTDGFPSCCEGSKREFCHDVGMPGAEVAHKVNQAFWREFNESYRPDPQPTDGRPLLLGTLDRTGMLWSGWCPICGYTHTHSWNAERDGLTGVSTRHPHCTGKHAARDANEQYAIALDPAHDPTHRAILRRRERRESGKSKR